MDPHTKEFHPVDPEKLEQLKKVGDPAVFEVGQRFLIGNVLFAIRKITRKDLVIRPVK